MIRACGDIKVGGYISTVLSRLSTCKSGVIPETKENTTCSELSCLLTGNASAINI